MIEFYPLLISFLIAYIGVSVLGFGVYLIISKVRGTSPWDEVEVRQNVSYQIANKFLPLINLVVWFGCAALYFRWASEPSFTAALVLGVIWLVVSAVIDYVGFVLAKHPLSVDHKGFYVGQAPWIYFTYLAVFIAPIFYALLVL